MLKQANERLIRQLKADKELQSNIEAVLDKPIQEFNLSIENVLDDRKQSKTLFNINSYVEHFILQVKQPLLDEAFKYHAEIKDILFFKLDDSADRFCEVCMLASLNTYMNHFRRVFHRAYYQRHDESRASSIYYESWRHYWEGRKQLDKASMGKALGVRVSSNTKKKLGEKKSSKGGGNFYMTKLNKELQQVVEEELEKGLEVFHKKISKELNKTPYQKLLLSEKNSINNVGMLTRRHRKLGSKTKYDTFFTSTGEGLIYVDEDDIFFLTKDD